MFNIEAKRTIQIARWVVEISGTGISALHLYWKIQDRGMGQKSLVNNRYYLGPINTKKLTKRR